MDENTRKEILEAIESQGYIDEAPEVPSNIHLANEANIQNLIDHTSGLRKIRSAKAKEFVLILSQPTELHELWSLQIRCCLCHKVISYPAWYYRVVYNVNSFHYFVCFDAAEPTKPTARCANFGL